MTFNVLWAFILLLVEPLSRTHGALDVQRADVLPMLLEKRNQKVDGQVNVLNQLIFIHGQISDGNAQAQYLEKNVQFFEDGINKGGLSEHRSHRIEKIESTF